MYRFLKTLFLGLAVVSIGLLPITDLSAHKSDRGGKRNTQRSSKHSDKKLRHSKNHHKNVSRHGKERARYNKYRGLQRRSFARGKGVGNGYYYSDYASPLYYNDNYPWYLYYNDNYPWDNDYAGDINSYYNYSLENYPSVSTPTNLSRPINSQSPQTGYPVDLYSSTNSNSPPPSASQYSSNALQYPSYAPSSQSVP